MTVVMIPSKKQLIVIRALISKEILFSGYFLSVKEALERCALDKVDLCGADLKNLDLIYAGGSNFTGTDLTGADMKMTFLSEAYFMYACLIKTDFRGALVQETLFYKARFGKTDFRDCDTSTAGFNQHARNKLARGDEIIWLRESEIYIILLLA